MRHFIFWFVIAALLAGRVVYYDEIRGHQAPDGRVLVHKNASNRTLASTTSAGADERVAPIRVLTAR